MPSLNVGGKGGGGKGGLYDVDEGDEESLLKETGAARSDGQC